MSDTLKEGENYLLFEKGHMAGGKLAGMTNAEICAICTKNYIFIVPKKDFTTYLVASRIREYNYFGDGVKPTDGLKQIVADTSLTVSDLETRMLEILDDQNRERVVRIDELEKFKILTGLLGQARLKFPKKLAPLVLVLKGNGGMKAFKKFYRG